MASCEWRIFDRLPNQFTKPRTPDRVASAGRTSNRRTTTISHQIDFKNYVTSLLTNASSMLKRKEPPDLCVASNLDRIVATAEEISSGYWLRIAPLYEPFAPKLQLAVKELNDRLIDGADSPSAFDQYIEQLVEILAEPVAA